MSLIPKKPSIPKSDIHDYLFLLYGEPKIGKTSLASRFPDALFFMFEPGGTGLSVYQTPVLDEWRLFTKAIDELKEGLSKGTMKFKTVVLDTVEECYKVCFRDYCKSLGITHPQDENDFGKTWGQIKDEFVYQMQRLMSLPIGVLIISHQTVQERKYALGGSYHTVAPSMSRAPGEYLEAVVDIIGHYSYKGTTRRLVIQGNDQVVAGHRAEAHFRTVDGLRVVEIDMGSSPDESYNNLLDAWNNNLTSQYIEVDSDHEEGRASNSIQTSGGAKQKGRKRISLKRKQ